MAHSLSLADAIAVGGLLAGGALLSRQVDRGTSAEIADLARGVLRTGCAKHVQRSRPISLELDVFFRPE